MANAKTTTTSTRNADDSAADTLGGQAAIVTEDLKALGRVARETTTERLADLTSTAKGMVAQCADHGRRVGTQVTEFVRRKPVAVLMVTLGVGALAGLFFSRRRGRRFRKSARA